jgi:outer membrane murein-binding lipoprotein Lpp
MSSGCYNPDTFRPADTPLLAKGQWSMVQLFLVDAANLPLTTEAFPDEGAIPIFRKIHDASAIFASSVLPKSMATGAALYNYGMTSAATFEAVANLLNQANPDRTTLSSLFGSLTKSAADAQSAAGDLFTGTKAYADELSRQKPLLLKLVSDEMTSAGGLKSQIDPLNTDIEAQRAVIKAAQVAITQDAKVIHDTVYYAWIPLIGAIVALAESISSQNDIQAQLQRIQTAVNQIETDNQKIRPLRRASTTTRLTRSRM